MNEVPSPNNAFKRRVVPGPKSKAIFAEEAKVMAPGLQSIALFSQIVVDHAEGCTITDVDGNEYLDFIAGIAVGSVGHSHPHYVKRLKEQLERSTFGSFTTETRARFLKLVASLLPEGLTHLQLFSGGAEAVEAAFRLAKSVTKKFEFIGFWGGFHGKSQGVIGMLGGALSQPPGAVSTGHASFALCELLPLPVQSAASVVWRARCAEHLRNVIKNDTQGELAAIIIEPMQGTAGNVIPPDDFIHAVREIATETGALLIADEILVGFGRTGKMWASDQFGLKPDIMTIGKGIGGGFPLSAVASSLERMSAAPFGEPSGSSSSYRRQSARRRGGAWRGRGDPRGQARREFRPRRKGHARSPEEGAGKYRFIGDVRGRGLLIGVEMVADRKTKEPLDKTITRALFHEAFERGLITMSYSERHSHQPASRHHRGRGAARGRYPRSVFRGHCASVRARLSGNVLKGAFIGFGNVAANGHLPGWRARDDVRIVAATDAAASRREAFLAACPDGRWYDTADDLLAGEKLDFADICAPPGSHAALIERALDAGLHVLSEKPLVTQSRTQSAWQERPRALAASCTRCITGSKRRSAARFQRWLMRARSARAIQSAGGR